MIETKAFPGCIEQMALLVFYCESSACIDIHTASSQGISGPDKRELAVGTNLEKLIVDVCAFDGTAVIAGCEHPLIPF